MMWYVVCTFGWLYWILSFAGILAKIDKLERNQLARRTTDDVTFYRNLLVKRVQLNSDLRLYFLLCFVATVLLAYLYQGAS